MKDVKDIIQEIEKQPLEERIKVLNAIKIALHEISPFKNEPVDCVIWVPSDLIYANDYNPNVVAPPEMELLKTSIEQDGYTQPIVSWETEGKFQVVDGFHRNRVGKECKGIKKRIHGYLPITIVNKTRLDREDRIASTIRHNRARGKHKVEAMSDIVIELKKRNWSNEKISKNLGMDADEVLRLCQISGLVEVFSNTEFSQAWEAEIYKEDDFKFLSEEDIKSEERKQKGIKRIFHTWEKWECYKAGFYEEQPPAGFNQQSAEEFYRDFLSDLPLFEVNLRKVITTWKFSCEHYLTNENMNRIAWLGQASVCIHKGIPSKFRGGYNLLTDEQKIAADNLALKYLNIWLSSNGYETLSSISEAQSKTEADLY
jgi:ParB-like chromosome segregation protein Spo0J